MAANDRKNCVVCLFDLLDAKAHRMTVDFDGGLVSPIGRYRNLAFRSLSASGQDESDPALTGIGDKLVGNVPGGRGISNSRPNCPILRDIPTRRDDRMGKHFARWPIGHSGQAFKERGHGGGRRPIVGAAE